MTFGHSSLAFYEIDVSSKSNISPKVTGPSAEVGIMFPTPMRRTENVRTRVTLNPTRSPEAGGSRNTKSMRKLKKMTGNTVVAMMVPVNRRNFRT